MGIPDQVNVGWLLVALVAGFVLMGIVAHLS
jgi:hypothetical protein